MLPWLLVTHAAMVIGDPCCHVYWSPMLPWLLVTNAAMFIGDPCCNGYW